MNEHDARELLEAVKRGDVSIDDAIGEMRNLTTEVRVVIPEYCRRCGDRCELEQ